MGRGSSANGDGWGSACRAADKLFLINGFSPGHLIPLALGLKSNLTLCMSVNINPPIVSRVAPGKRANLTAALVMVEEGGGGVREEEKGRKKLKSCPPLFSHPSTPPVSKEPLPRLIQDHRKAAPTSSFRRKHLETYINPFPFILVHCQLRLGYMLYIYIYS